MGEMTTELGSSARKNVDELRSAAEQKASERFGERKNVAVQEAMNIARALRRTADNLEEENQPTVASYARRTADAVERVGGALERKSGSDIVSDIERVCKEHPALVGVGTALVGFLGARVLRSSTRRRSGDGHERLADIEPPPQGGLS